MTTLVGVVYPDGLVMASDKLATIGSVTRGQRVERKKLYFRNGLAVGYAGTSTAKAFNKVRRNINKLLSKHTIDALIREELIQLFANANLTPIDEFLGPNWYPNWYRTPFLLVAPHIDRLVVQYRLDALIGYYLNRTFRLGYYPGFGETLIQRGNAVVISPKKRDFSDFFADVKNLNDSRALELAVSIVRDNNRRYPEVSSGLEAVQITRRETKRLLYEHILK